MADLAFGTRVIVRATVVRTAATIRPGWDFRDTDVRLRDMHILRDRRQPRASRYREEQPPEWFGDPIPYPDAPATYVAAPAAATQRGTWVRLRRTPLQARAGLVVGQCRRAEGQLFGAIPDDREGELVVARWVTLVEVALPPFRWPGPAQLALAWHEDLECRSRGGGR